jgi:hypothetical protein
MENFNLKSVVDFLEENGFCVFEAREYAFDKFISRREIGIKIARKGEENRVFPAVTR